MALRKAKLEHTPERDSSYQVRHYPREYRHVNDGRKEAYFDFKCHPVHWGDGSLYKMGRKVGQGHFGEVFLAKNRKTREVYVVKTLKLSHREQTKLQQEVRLLQLVRGGPNICQLIDTVAFKSGEFAGKKGLVFERVNYQPYKKLFPRMSIDDQRVYLLQLLTAVEYTHSLGIIHRDIKPSNILIDPDTETLQLIDWGVGGFYRSDRKNSRGPGTRCYMAPELCVAYDYYDYAVDMWSVGCVVGSMIFLASPMMRGKGSWFNQLAAITEVVGTEALFTYLDKLCVALDTTSLDLLEGMPGRAWEDWVDDTNRHLSCDDSIDLIAKLIVCDHTERLTAGEAIRHPFFDRVRGRSSSTTKGGKRRKGSSSGTSASSGSYEYEYTYSYESPP